MIRSLLNYIVSYYLYIYPFAIFACVLVNLFFKAKWKNEIVNWLYVINTIVPFLFLYTLITVVLDLFTAWYCLDSHEYWAFKEGNEFASTPSNLSFWIISICSSLLPQILWLKKFRKKVLLSLVIAFLSTVFIFYEKVIVFITNLYRDYLPSSWSTWHDSHFSELFLKIILFFLVTIVVYWFLSKRKKLPNSSTLFSYSLFFISYFLFTCIQPFN